jgi:hypothetical protein
MQEIEVAQYQIPQNGHKGRPASPLPPDVLPLAGKLWGSAGPYRAVDAMFVQQPEQISLVEQKFRHLADQWHRETRFESSMTRLTNHQAYRRITAMGPAVVPILLRELETNPDWWFTALSDITEDDPVEPRHAGDLEEMRNAWVRWGRERGYL